LKIDYQIFRLSDWESERYGGGEGEGGVLTADYADGADTGYEDATARRYSKSASVDFQGVATGAQGYA